MADKFDYTGEFPEEHSPLDDSYLHAELDINAIVDQELQLARREAKEPKQHSEKVSKSTAIHQRTIGLVRDKVDFYKDQHAKPYGLLTHGYRADVYYLDHSSFADLIARLCYEQFGEILADNQLKQVSSHLSSVARFQAQTRPVYVRSFTDSDGITYIHVANEEGDVISVAADKWSLIKENECPVLFWRTPIQKNLVLPARGGDVELLRSYANFDSPDMLYVFAVLVAFYLEGMGPFPICVLNGQPGAGKSELAALIKELADNSIANTQMLPRNMDDFIISQRQSKLSVYDNVESLTPDQSNLFCLAVTGGHLIKRELYTTCEVSSFEITSGLIFTTIHSMIERDDLADRSISFELNRLGEGQFKSKKQLLLQRAAHLPLILGALLDLLCSIKKVMAEQMPQVQECRLADFSVFGTAAESYLGLQSGSFVQSILQSQRTFAPGLKSKFQSFFNAINKYFATVQCDWKGGAGSLLQAVEQYKDPKTKNWPETNEAAGRQLKALQKGFDIAGIEAYLDTSGGRNWVFKLSKEFINRAKQNSAELLLKGKTTEPACLADKNDFPLKRVAETHDIQDAATSKGVLQETAQTGLKFSSRSGIGTEYPRLKRQEVSRDIHGNMVPETKVTPQWKEDFRAKLRRSTIENTLSGDDEEDSAPV